MLGDTFDDNSTLKADKGNTICILDKADYICRGEEMLSDPNVYECLKKNPLRSEQKTFNKELENIFKKCQLHCLIGSKLTCLHCLL